MHPRSSSIDSLPEPTVPVAKHVKFYHFSGNGYEGFDISDTIILCDDVTDTTFNPSYYNTICNIVAKDGLTTKPTYHYNVGMNGPLFAGQGIHTGLPVSISGIHLKITNGAAPPFSSSTANITIDNCIITQNGNTMVMASCDDFIITNTLVKITSESYTYPIANINSGKKLSANNCTFIALCDLDVSFNGLDDISEYTNNIFYFPNKTQPTPIISNSSLVVENNLYFVTTQDIPLLADGGDIDTIFADPLFAETDTYTLSNTSPAIGAGINGVNIGWDLLTKKANTNTSSTPGITSNSFAHFYPNLSSYFV